MPGARLPRIEPAHLSVFVMADLAGLSPGDPALEMSDDPADLLEGGVEAYGGSPPSTRGHVALVEFAEATAAVGFALDLIERAGARNGWARAGVHVGRVKPDEDAVGGHAARVAAGLADLAEPDEVLITGAVIVEMGDDGFERFATGSMGAAELDDTSYTIYRIDPR